jgi:hypothetical protein
MCIYIYIYIHAYIPHVLFLRDKQTLRTFRFGVGLSSSGGWFSHALQLMIVKVFMGEQAKTYGEETSK